MIPGPQELEVWPPSLVKKHLDRFLDAEILKKGAAQGTLQQMILVLDARQVADQTDIKEIELRRFGDPLAEVAVIRRQQIDDPAGFQDGGTNRGTAPLFVPVLFLDGPIE